jgi:hypothetical protein
MVKKPFTSDGQERANVQPRAAPTLPAAYGTIGEGARVGVLNDFGTMLNNQLTYWASVTPPCAVLDRRAAYGIGHGVMRINAIIATMNAACAEFSILTGAGAQMKQYVWLDYNGFVPAINAIRAQLSAMQTAKP